MGVKNCELPEQLSRDKLEEILTKKYGNVELKRVEVMKGSKAGDHNLSYISRIIAHFVKDSRELSESFIFKDPIEGSIVLDLIGGVAKEVSWYEKINPEIEKLNVNIGAKCYMINSDRLLFEDLTVQGYKVIDRKALLDLEHCLQAVRALARFHAVTHHLYETDNLPETAIKETQFVPSNEHVFDVSGRFDKLIVNLKEMGQLEYCEVVNKLKPVSWDKMLKSVHENQEFLSLVQGDYWTTNIMFKYDRNEKVSDAKIIDFQLIKVGSPAYDLHFFVCSSIKPQVRDNHLQEIYKEYLKHLNLTLKQISSKKSMSQEQFDRMMKRTEFMGVFTTLTFLPVPLCEDPLQMRPPEHYTEEQKKNYSPFEVVYRQKIYRQHLLSLLDFYKRTNVI